MTLSEYCLAKFQINSRSYFVARKTTKIKTIDLFHQLSSAHIFPKVYFSHRDDSEKRIAYGKLLSCQKTPRISLKNQIKGASFDIRFYGGKAFESDPEKTHPFLAFSKEYFFMPQHEITQNNNEFFHHCYDISTHETFSPNFTGLTLYEEKKTPTLDFKVIDCSHFPNNETWNKRIDSLIEDIQNNILEKAVIARQSIIKLDRKIDPFILLKKLQAQFSHSSLFCFQFKKDAAFLGATPECLYTRKGRHLRTEAIAGTCSSRASTNLLCSEKEVKEFGYVTRFLAKKLNELSSSLNQDKSKVVDIGYLRHLYSLFEAKLLPEISDDEIISKLFPSPALCGTPTQTAFEKIKQLEDFNRHWYASPVGWISENQAQLIIAIRSCLISAQTVNLFVGNGIVKDSDPQKEWNELNVKLKPFFTLFNHESTQL
ncbi:MAG: Isochorismate synthase MenF [Chlamydiae bacterium]|nr:Isochorismate synthase MenF [Chlamydiota bacterium]